MKKMTAVLAMMLVLNSLTVSAAEMKTDQVNSGDAVAQETTKALPNDITRIESDPAQDELDYVIRVNRALNFTVVYAQDVITKEFTVPVIEFANSTGKNNSTPVGEYSITRKHRWQTMFHDVYTQYAVRFQPHIMFHSPYYTKKNNPSSLNWTQYNLLGKQASAGCVREATIDTKWLYDHCKIGTPVIVYDDPEEQSPFGELHTVTIPKTDPNRGWDPTDPNPENPWQKVRPVLALTQFSADHKTITLAPGATMDDLRAQIKLMTPEGTEYATEDYALEIYGLYSLNVPGDYQIYVRGFDLETTLRADETFTLSIV